jgi:excisionase family DNA binding protein
LLVAENLKGCQQGEKGSEMAQALGLTTREAAERLGISLHRLYELLWEKKIPGQRVYGRWFVDQEAVEKRRRRRPQALSPRKNNLGPPSRN